MTTKSLVFLLCSCFCFLISPVLMSQTARVKKAYQYYEEAESYFLDGHYNEAKAILDECLNLYPGYMEAYSLRAASKEQLNDLQGAISDYSSYLEEHPDNPEVLFAAALVRYHLRFYDEARSNLLKVLTLKSSETNVLLFRQNMSVNDRSPILSTANDRHTAAVFNYLGLIETKTGHFDKAITYFDSAIRRDNREADFYVNRGLAKEQLNDSSAVVDYQLALSVHPDHTLAKHNLNALTARKGLSISKEQRLTTTIEHDSTMVYPFLERALERYQSGNYAGALQDYDHALKMDKLNADIWFGRGQAREKLEDYEGAFADYTKAIDLEENHSGVWLSRGNVLLKLGRFEDAIEDYNVALIYYPDMASAHYNKAMAKFRLNQFKEACTDLKKAEALGMKADAKVKQRICGE